MEIKRNPDGSVEITSKDPEIITVTPKLLYDVRSITVEVDATAKPIVVSPPDISVLSDTEEIHMTYEDSATDAISGIEKVINITDQNGDPAYCEWSMIGTDRSGIVEPIIKGEGTQIKWTFDPANDGMDFDIHVISNNQYRLFRRAISNVVPDFKEGDPGVTTIKLNGTTNAWQEQPLTNKIIVKGNGDYFGMMNQTQGTKGNPVWIKFEGAVLKGTLGFNSGCEYIYASGQRNGGLRCADIIIDSGAYMSKHGNNKASNIHIDGAIVIGGQYGINIKTIQGKGTADGFKVSNLICSDLKFEGSYIFRFTEDQGYEKGKDFVMHHCLFDKSGNDGIQIGNAIDFECHDNGTFEAGSTDKTDQHCSSLSNNQGNNGFYYFNNFIDGKMIMQSSIGKTGGDTFFISNRFKTKYPDNAWNEAIWHRVENNPNTPTLAFINNEFEHPTKSPLDIVCANCGVSKINLVLINNKSNIPVKDFSTLPYVAQNGMPVNLFAEFLSQFDIDGYKIR